MTPSVASNYERIRKGRAGVGNHGSGGGPLRTLQYPAAPAVFAGPEKGRDHHDLRKLRPNPLLQSRAERGRSGRTAACNMSAGVGVDSDV